MTKRVEVGDVCNNGHIVEGANIIPLNGNRSIGCRECVLNRKKLYAQSEKGKATAKRNSARSESQRLKRNARAREVFAAKQADVKLVKEIKSNASYASISYLKMGKRASDASLALEDQYSKGRSKCFDKPEKYMDYDENNPPSNAEAYELCNGCPMLVECARFANALRPPIGVWGGQRWDTGKVVPNDKEIK